MAETLTPARSAPDRRAMRAAGILALAGIAVKLVSTGKESMLAALYGRSDVMDAYLAAFLVPNLLINVVAESMNQALIPTLICERMRAGRERAQELLSSSTAALCGLLAAASVLMALAARAFFPVLGSNFAQAKLQLSIHLFYLLLPCLLLGGIASNCTAVLNAEGRFAMPALAPAAVPLTIVAGTLAFHGPLGIWALAWATVLGMAIHSACVVAAMRPCGFTFSLRWHGWTEPVRSVAGQYGPAILSSVVASGGLLVGQAMAAMLPAGSVSALVFAGRFVSVAVSLPATAISSALGPHLSELAALHDWSGCRTALRVWGGRAALASTALATALIAGARPLVRVVLQHGVFERGDSSVVAWVLIMYALQIPFYVVSRVPYRLILALRRTDLVFYCGGINLALDIVLNLVLMRWMGVAGIALATSLWCVSTCALLWFWAQRLLRRAEREGEEVLRP